MFCAIYFILYHRTIDHCLDDMRSHNAICMNIPAFDDTYIIFRNPHYLDVNFSLAMFRLGALTPQRGLIM